MRGKGTHDPGLNPNSYPMTDVARHPSAVRVVVNGVPAGMFDLRDDPADHRGSSPGTPRSGTAGSARPAPTASSSRRPSPPRP